MQGTYLYKMLFNLRFILLNSIKSLNMSQNDTFEATEKHVQTNLG